MLFLLLLLVCGALSIVPRALVLLFVAKRWRRSDCRQRYRFIFIFVVFLVFVSVEQWYTVVAGPSVSRWWKMCHWRGRTFWCIDMGRVWERERGEGGRRGDAAGARTRILIVVCVCEWAWKVRGVSTMTASWYEHAIHFHQTEFSLSLRSLRSFSLFCFSHSLWTLVTDTLRGLGLDLNWFSYPTLTTLSDPSHCKPMSASLSPTPTYPSPNHTSSAL